MISKQHCRVFEINIVLQPEHITITPTLLASTMAKFFTLCFVLFIFGNLCHAQWTSLHGPEGDLVWCVASSDSSLFAGTWEDGLYRRKYNDTHWESSSGWKQDFGNEIYDIAAKDTTIYIVTEEGVFRSTEDGESFTWDFTGSIDEPWSILIKNENVYVTNDFGLYRLDDNGFSWVLVLGNISANVLAQCGDNILVGTSGQGVLVSEDEGNTWLDVNSAFADAEILSLSTQDSIAFATTTDGEVFYSDDSGMNWTTVDDGLPNIPPYAVTMFGPDVFVGFYGGGIYKSSDFGTTWMSVNYGMPNNYPYSFTSYGSKLYAATKGGVFESDDSGENWMPFNTGFSDANSDHVIAIGETILATPWRGGIYKYYGQSVDWLPVIEGMGATEIQGLIYSGESIIAATTNGVFISENLGENWQQMNNGLENLNTHCVAVDGTNLFVGTEEGAFISFDNGLNWSPTFTAITGSIANLLFNEAFVYVSSESGIFRSSDDGANWIQVSDIIPNSLISNGTTLFAGMFGGGVKISSDNGDTWNNSSTGLANSYIYCLLPIGSAVLAGTNGGVFRSYNNGESWTLVSANNATSRSLSAADGFVYSAGNGIWRAPLSTVLEVDETPQSISWSVYPNPFTQTTNINFGEQIVGALISIYTLEGKQLLNKQFTGTTMEIDRGSLEPGLYFLNVADGRNSSAQKLMVE